MLCKKKKEQDTQTHTHTHRKGEPSKPRFKKGRGGGEEANREKRYKLKWHKTLLALTRIHTNTHRDHTPCKCV